MYEHPVHPYLPPENLFTTLLCSPMPRAQPIAFLSRGWYSVWSKPIIHQSISAHMLHLHLHLHHAQPTRSLR